MSETRIENVWSKLFSSVHKSFHKAKRRKIPNDEAQQNDNDIEEKRTKLKNLVEEARDVIDNGKCLNCQFIGKLNEAENYGDIIDYVFRNNLIMDLDLEQTKNYLDKLFKDLKDLIPNRPENQLSGHKMEDINIQPGNVRRCLLFLLYFPKHYVFNLKRITRLSVPNEVIPKNLQQISDFLEVADRSCDIIDEAPNHFLLKANGREHILQYPERHYLSRKTSLEGIKSEQSEDSYPYLFFKVGKDVTQLPDFKEWKFVLLRFLSLRNVNLIEGISLNLNNLSSLKYLDLKHTKVRDCSWLECLEKLQMLDLRYTYVKEIPENYLENLGKLQHLLLGYIKEEGENQLVGTKLNVKKLKTTYLKTLRAIEQPEVIEEISSVSNVVDLSVTGLTMECQQTFWGILENFENLSSLGVAVTRESAITLQDCGDELKKKLKRLRMEGLHSGLEKLGDFENLIDLTLASHKPIDTNSIPGLPNLLCLRLYGDCQETICQIGLQGFDRLMKLVIGDMGNVETVQIGCSVIETIATLKLSNLPFLREVVYLDKQHSNKQHSLLRWENSTAEVCSEEVHLHKTIFLRYFNKVPVDNSPCLTIYHYDKDKQCYKYANHDNRR